MWLAVLFALCAPMGIEPVTSAMSGKHGDLCATDALNPCGEISHVYIGILELSSELLYGKSLVYNLSI